MKVISTRVGVLVAGCTLLASGLGLTAISVSSVAAGTVSAVSITTVSAAKQCPAATVIEAARCHGIS